MARGWSHAGRKSARWLVVAALLAAPAPALAHKLYVFAQVEDGTIRGRAYFPGDIPAQKSEVIARDPAGRELNRTETDAAGKFTIAVRERVDYCLVAETSDGHSGQYIVHAAELPGKKLAANAVQPEDGAAATSGANIPPLVKQNARSPTAAGSEQSAAIGTQLEELRKQVQELRRQLFESDERLRFRDILGGIGFILGLAGVACYMKARSRCDRRAGTDA